nr:hypothetical protein [Tanacetum cinerariifolium]
MRTRSKSYPFNSNATIPRRSNKRRVPNIVEPEIRTIEKIVPMADRTMKELLQAPTEGYGEAIVILEILAENFEFKTNLLQMTATLKYKDVSNDAIKLMLFPYSLEGAARIWYEKEPLISILTWDDLVNKFVNQFFHLSKTTHLKNEISRFTQRFEETFGEAWDSFKEMLRACPHHGFSKLTQIDTFYNGLNEQDQDSLNAAAGGNLLNKTTREALKIIENKSKVRYLRSKSNVSRVNTNSKDNVSKTDDRIDKLTNQISNLVEIVNKQVITPATAKAVEKTCVTYGGAHAYYDCIATNSNQPSVCAATSSYKQVSPPNRASHQIPPLGFALVQNNPNRVFKTNHFQHQVQPGISNELSSYMKSNEIMIKSMQNQINVLRGDFNKQEENLRRNLNNDMRSILGTFFQNQASTLGTLPSNTVPNPKVEQNTEEITNKEHSICPGSTAQVQPPVVPIFILEPDVPRTQPKPTIPYPSRLNDQKLREKATNQMEKFFQIFHDLHFDISFTDALRLMPKFASTIKSLLTNKEKLFELAKVPLNENCLAMLLKKLPENIGDPELTPTRMTLELADRSITCPKGVVEDVFVKVGKFHFPTDFVVVDFKSDPRVPLILGRSFLRTDRALIDVYREEITLRYNSKSSNPTLVSDPSIPESDFKEPIVKSSSPTLTPFGENKMSRDVITVGSTMRIPLLYRSEYSQWRERFMNYLEEQTNGETAEEKKTQKIDRLARSLLIQGLPNDIYSLFNSNETAKDLWDALERQMRGSEYGDQDRKAAILYKYETFKATEGEQLLDTYLHYLQVINDVKKCGYKKDNCELNYKFLNEWKQYGTPMRQTKNLMDINIDALYNILKQNQGDVNDALGYKKKAVVITSDLFALVTEKTKVSKQKEKVVVFSNSKGSGADGFSELKKITALLAKAFNRRKFYSKPINNNLRTSSTSQSANKKQEFVKSDDKKVEKKDDEKKRDMSKVKCYNCKKEGHFAKDCKKAKVKDYNYYKTKMLLQCKYDLHGSN